MSEVVDSLRVNIETSLDFKGGDVLEPAKMKNELELELEVTLKLEF